jgi:hypothetical protein
MNGRVAKAKRREKTIFKRKQLFSPLTVPVKTGKFNEDGTPEYQETYIPRRQRRKIMRKFQTDIRKGRIDPTQLLENMNVGQ